jgi:hypothetical protein
MSQKRTWGTRQKKIPPFDFAQGDDKQESKGKAGLMELCWAY